MDFTIEVFELLSLAFFTLSLLALRYTVISQMQGNKDSFSMFLNLHKNTGFMQRERLFCNAIFRTFKKGKKKTKSPPNISEDFQYEGLVGLIGEAEQYRSQDPKYGDSCLYAIRSISWGIWAVRSAFIAFIIKILVFILKLIETYRI